MLDYLSHGLDLFLRDHPSAGMVIAEDFNKLNLRSLGLKLNLESWDAVFNTSDVDEKVNIFTTTLKSLLDQCLQAECSIKVHPSDKPWLTPQIKREMKARHQTYARGDSVEYKERCEKVSGLVSKAKLRYYKSKVENTKHYDQSKLS